MRLRANYLNAKPTDTKKLYYVVCWTEPTGMFSCDHEHLELAGALSCETHIPNGASFIRAIDHGVFRSLNDTEFGYFLVAIRQMPWSKLSSGNNSPSVNTL